MRKPIVLPEPVCAIPIRSRPTSEMGRDCAWMGVRPVYFFVFMKLSTFRGSSSASSSELTLSRSSNSAIGCNLVLVAEGLGLLLRHPRAADVEVLVVLEARRRVLCRGAGRDQAAPSDRRHEPRAAPERQADHTVHACRQGAGPGRALCVSGGGSKCAWTQVREPRSFSERAKRARFPTALVLDSRTE
eukprot:6819404-Prymnesium_polylepis.1